MLEPRRTLPSPDILSAAHAIGQLDGAVSTSVIAPLWRERAAVIGLAECLTLHGQRLTPAEFFRIVAGVQPVAHDTATDRAAIVATACALLPTLGAAPAVTRLLGAIRRRQAYDDDAQPPLSHATRAAIRAALDGDEVADVGTALSNLGGRVDAARLAGGQAGWMPAVLAQVAALLPAALARWGVTHTPLPCLTGLMRTPALYNADSEALGQALLLRLGAQAGAGLTLLRRLEACAAAWRDRLHGRSARSHSGQAAALFLVWPALTRRQIANVLSLSAPGAGGILETLVACEIVEVQRVGATRFFVAPESLADFRLQPRQGRHRAPPRRLDCVNDLGDAVDAVDAALAVFDRLKLRPLPGLENTSGSDPAYQDQPSGLSLG